MTDNVGSDGAHWPNRSRVFRYRVSERYWWGWFCTKCRWGEDDVSRSEDAHQAFYAHRNECPGKSDNGSVC